MKIVVLDGATLNPGDISWAGFQKLGEFVCHDRTPADKILERIGDADAALTNKTPLAREIFAAKPGLKYVGVLATGYNVVDVAAAKEMGVVVTNIPTYGTASVAQYVFALLLEVCHHVGHHARSVRDGNWSKPGMDFCYWDYPLVELAGKTLGIVGFGRIGRDVAKIAAAFGMNTLAYDVAVDKSLENDRFAFAPLDRVMAGADVLSLHVPLFDSTRDMVNAASIAGMKDGVIVINTSRGPLVNEADMAAALAAGKVGYYAADVVSVEPMRLDNPLRTAKNCLVTPHIAWAPKAARLRLMDIAVANLAAFAGGRPVNVVNP